MQRRAAASAANEDNGRLHLETGTLRVIGIVSAAHALLPRSSDGSLHSCFRQYSQVIAT